MPNPVAMPPHTARNAALLAAEHERTAITRDAHVEYAEAVGKLREAFERDLAHARAELLARVTPAYRAYNAAVIAAERAHAAALA